MHGEVGGIVAAWVNVKFVRDLARSEVFVQCGSASVETVIVLIAAIEVNLEAGEICGASQRERAVGIPEGGIRRAAENSAENAGTRGLRGSKKVGKFFDECGAVSADGNEELRMAEGEMQRAESAHRNAGNGAVSAAGSDTIVSLDKGEKFLEQKILIAYFSIL